MRYTITIIVLLLASMHNLFSQTRTIKHIVQRGETYASIATKYGISEEQIKEENPLCENCYIGLSLNITLKETKGEVVSQPTSTPALNYTRSEYEAAVSFAEAGKHKKAIKIYDKLIEEYPQGKFYLNRGLSQYERGKWKQSINDLEAALASNELSEADSYQAEQYLDRAREYRSEQLENRANIWSCIAATALVTTAAIVQASNAKNASQTTGVSSSSTSSSSSIGSSDDYSESSTETPTVKSPKECPVCHGVGSIVDYTATYGITNKDYCDVCKKTVAAGHYHKPCIHCHGKGYK